MAFRLFRLSTASVEGNTVDLHRPAAEQLVAELLVG
jgi:hypothetical protein